MTKWLITLAAAVTRPNYDRERSLFPNYRIDRISVYGTPGFTRQVSDALSRLKAAYPYGYSLAQRYIHAIVESNARRGMGIALGVVFQRSSGQGELPVPASRFAAHLVRHAIAFRKLLAFNIWRSPRSELGSLNRELRAMRQLGCDQEYFHRPLNIALQLERRLRKGC